MKKLVLVLILALFIGCTSTTAKVERSDEEIAASIKADNEKFNTAMEQEGKNGASLDGITEFGLLLWQISNIR